MSVEHTPLAFHTVLVVCQAALRNLEANRKTLGRTMEGPRLCPFTHQSLRVNGSQPSDSCLMEQLAPSVYLPAAISFSLP